MVIFCCFSCSWKRKVLKGKRRRCVCMCGVVVTRCLQTAEVAGRAGSGPSDETPMKPGEEGKRAVAPSTYFEVNKPVRGKQIQSRSTLPLISCTTTRRNSNTYPTRPSRTIMTSLFPLPAAAAAAAAVADWSSPWPFGPSRRPAPSICVRLS